MRYRVLIFLLSCIFFGALVPLAAVGADGPPLREFEILLCARGAANEGAADLVHCEDVFVGIEDIIAYEWNTHTIVINRTAKQRIDQLAWWRIGGWSLSRPDFVVRVKGEVIYKGRFVSPLQSSLQRGPQMLMFPVSQLEGLRIGFVRLNGAGETIDRDPRTDERIRIALQSAHLLKE